MRDAWCDCCVENFRDYRYTALASPVTENVIAINPKDQPQRLAPLAAKHTNGSKLRMGPQRAATFSGRALVVRVDLRWHHATWPPLIEVEREDLERVAWRFYVLCVAHRGRGFRPSFALSRVADRFILCNDIGATR